MEKEQEEELLHQNKNAGKSNILLIFLGVQFIYFILFLASFQNSLFFILYAITVFICFIFNKSYFGRNLTGFSWKINLSQASHWSYQIEPDPFVPRKIDSNAFWISLILSVISSLIGTIVFIVQEKYFIFSFSLLLTVFPIINYIAFSKIQQIANKQSADTVRSVLLGNDLFGDAISDYSEEEEEEEEEHPDVHP